MEMKLDNLTKQQVEAIISSENARLAKEDGAKKAIENLTLSSYSDNPVVPHYKSDILLSDAVRELNLVTELCQPGDYCFKLLHSANLKGKVKRSQSILINCPFCNRIQSLGVKYQLVDTQPDNRIMRVLRAIFRQPKPHKIGKNLLTTTDCAVCLYNPKHKYSIIQNKITANTPMSGAS